MSEIKDFINNNSDRFLEELFTLLRIPSVSSQQEHAEDMQVCAQKYAEFLTLAGADRNISYKPSIVYTKRSRRQAYGFGIRTL